MRIYFYLLIATSVTVCAQPSHTFLRTAQGLGTGAGALQLLAELGALRAEQSVARARTRAAAIEKRMHHGQVSPTAYQRYKKLAHQQERSALKKVHLLEGAADGLSAAQEAGHIRNNLLERGLGSAAALSGIDIARSEIGGRMPLRYVLTLLDGSLSAARQWWYQSPEQLKWLTAAQATTRLLKNIARYGFKNKNKRVWLSYLLQLIRAGAGFIGDPREYKALDGQRLPGPTPNAASARRANYSFTGDGWFDSAAPVVEIGGRRYYPHLVRKKLRSDAGPADVEPVWGQLRAQAENLNGEGRQRAIALINRHQRLWSQHGILPDGRPGRGLELAHDHFDDNGNLRTKDGAVLNLTEYLSVRPGGTEPAWERLRTDAREILLQARRDHVLQQIAEAENTWRGKHAAFEAGIQQRRIVNGQRVYDESGQLTQEALSQNTDQGVARSFLPDGQEPAWPDPDTDISRGLVEPPQTSSGNEVVLSSGAKVPPRVKSYYFDDNGQVRDTNGNLVEGFEFLESFETQKEFDDFLNSQPSTPLSLYQQRQQARAYKDKWETIWNQRLQKKSKDHAAEKGLSVYFHADGNLLSKEADEFVGWSRYAAWSPGKKEPEWRALAENAALAGSDAGNLGPFIVSQADSSWQKEKELYKRAQENGDQYYFSDLGLLRLADDAATVLERNSDGLYEALLPSASSLSEDEPAWDKIVRPKTFRNVIVQRRIEKVIQKSRRAWNAHFYLERMAATARENGWQYYFATDGSLMRSADAELVSRNEGSYGALIQAPGSSEPSWGDLTAAAQLIPEEAVRNTALRLIDQHKRAWHARSRPEDQLGGVGFAENGDIQVEGHPPEMTPLLGQDGDLVGDLAQEYPYWNNTAQVVVVPIQGRLGIGIPFRLYHVSHCLSPFIYGVAREPNWNALRAEADRVVPHGYANMKAYEWISAYEALWGRYKEREAQQQEAERVRREAAQEREQVAALAAPVVDLPVAPETPCLICRDDIASLERVARNSNEACLCREALYCKDCAVSTQQGEGKCPMCRLEFTGISYYQPVAQE